jgi:hypothetical protein
MKIFRGGTPYALDVERLLKSYPTSELTEGRIVKHEELEAVLEISRYTSAGRYYGVINSWRTKEKSANSIIINWVPGTGLKVLDPSGVLEHAEVRTRQKSRQLCRATGIFRWVDRNRLDDIGQRRLDHQLIVSAKLAHAASIAQREMAIELAPVGVLPKRAIPTQMEGMV